jgi:uncharacterized Zn-binding protein involved in type VI secretion
VGDSASHGGSLIGPGSPSTRIDGGIKVCRVGDIYACPVHGPNPINSGSGITKVDGAALARVGDSTACGATITSGSPTWANA